SVARPCRVGRTARRRLGLRLVAADRRRGVRPGPPCGQPDPGSGQPARAARQRCGPVGGPRLPGPDHRSEQPWRAEHQMGPQPDLRGLMSGGIGPVRRRYGAHPAHLVVLLAGFVVAGLALTVLLGERPREVGQWLVGSAVLHDAVLVPAYIGVDAALVALSRRRPGRVPWLNHIRMPAALSGMLLLIWSPEILRRATFFRHQTGR